MTRFTLSLLLLLAGPAFAAPDDLDDFEFDEEPEEDQDKPERLEEGDDLDLLGDEPEDIDSLEGGDTGEDLLGDDAPEDEISTEGQDTSRIYREASEDFSNLAPDEEMLAWDDYLKQYPNSIYRDRIERHLDDLEASLYQQRRTPTEETRLDADQREVPISQGLLIENINPTSRILAGFEWGIPNYINLLLDYEHGFTRNFSVHAGVRNRYQVWNFETGVRYALVKSSRTQTLLTGMFDIRFALNPAYVAFRPQVAYGRMIGPFDIQVQAGVDLEGRSQSSVRLIGGANVTGRINEAVAVFVETNYNAKNLTWDRGGAFQFPVASFGLKLYPDIEGQAPGFMEVNIGASLPYATRYYRWHEGSIMGQVNFYL